jgi:hypothetical protein
MVGLCVADVEREHGSLFRALVAERGGALASRPETDPLRWDPETDPLRWDLCKREAPRRRDRVSSIDTLRARLYEQRDPNLVTRVDEDETSL